MVSPLLCLEAHGEIYVKSLIEAPDVSDTMVFQDLISIGLRETPLLSFENQMSADEMLAYIFDKNYQHFSTKLVIF